MYVKVELNFDKLFRALRRISERNVPFALARAVTDMAKLVRDDAKPRLNRIFQIRGTWVERGFRVVSADWKPTSMNYLTSTVGHKDPYMALQQEGGEKKPKGDKQGIPQDGAALSGGMSMPRGMAGERKTMRGSNWPRQLIAAIRDAQAARKGGKKSRNRAAKNKLIYMENARTITIAVRKKFGRGSNQGRDQFRALWFLVKTPVDIPKRWDFLERGEAMVRRDLPRLAQKRLDEVISRG